MANFYCPNCGSTDVNKSIGGKVEHAAAYGGVKLVKHFLGIGIRSTLVHPVKRFNLFHSLSP